MNICNRLILNSTMHRSLVKEYDGSRHTNWCSMIKSLDPNITYVNLSPVETGKWRTTIYFKSEEHKTWFILRWS
jgi:hypothetical protein